MHKLFTYGTLQDKSVQLALFNKTLKGNIDSIVGFEKQEITLGGITYPILIKNKQSTTNILGTCYTLSEEDLHICDEYEGEEYKRILVVLNSGEKSWVYVAS